MKLWDRFVGYLLGIIAGSIVICALEYLLEGSVIG